MPRVRPFRAVRYDPERAGRLEEVLAPPYDVIDPTLQDELYRRSPRNVVRLELGRAFPGDTDRSNRHTRAAALYRRWRESGILVLDAEPALYLYAQRYRWRGAERVTWGWVGAVGLEEPGEGAFLPHEATLPGPKADRLALWQETRAVFSQVFGLYHAPGEEAGLASDLMETPPLERCVDAQGVEHRVWRLPPGAGVDRLAGLLEPLQVVLADGHHRFETAVALARGPLRALPGAGWAALWLVNTALCPVTVLPTHRVVKAGAGGPSWEELIREVQERFRVEPLPSAREAAGGQHAVSPVQEPDDPHRIHLVGPDGSAWRLSHRDPLKADLAVVTLHREVLDPILKRVGGSQAEGFERLLRFTHDSGEAHRWVTTGEGAAAFLLPALDGEDVRRAAETTGRLPQKSTYFYPKVPSGLLIYDLEESLG